MTSRVPEDGLMWFDIDGVRYHAVVRGQGPTVLLLHGGGDHAGQWRGQLAALALALALQCAAHVDSLALIEPNPSGLLQDGDPDARAVLVTSADWGARMRRATGDELTAVLAAFVDARRGPGMWESLWPRVREAMLAARDELHYRALAGPPGASPSLPAGHPPRFVLRGLLLDADAPDVRGGRRQC